MSGQRRGTSSHMHDGDGKQVQIATICIRDGYVKADQ
jgi:hypothetical protein